ncbi:hypothetical protein D3C73_974520 [compost metagenome]
MGATAQLAGPRAIDLHYANFAAVVFTEQSHGAQRLGFSEPHHLGVHPEVVPDGDVGDLFDFGPRGCAQTLAPGEVEAKVSGLVVRTALGSFRAEDLVQRGMHNVRAGVGLLGSMATFTVDGGTHQRVGADLTFADDCLVNAEALDGALNVQDLDNEAVTGNEAGVS